MIRPILLASVFALAAPAMGQEVKDDMAPPVTEGIAAPDAQDQTAPNLPPGQVPTGMADDEAVDHEAMGHGATTQTGSGTGATGTMTTATTAQTTPEADPDATVTPSADATAGMTTTTPTGTAATAGTFTGMGGPIDIQAEWPSFDRVSDNRLSPMEFAAWLADSMGRPATGDSISLLNESADELAMVDTDNDWHVSREELMAASPQ